MCGINAFRTRKAPSIRAASSAAEVAGGEKEAARLLGVNLFFFSRF